MGVHPSAIISLEAKIAGGVRIEPFVIIKDRVVIKEGAIIYSYTRIEEDCVIGRNTFVGHGVIMRPNTIIGDNSVVAHGLVFEGDTVIGDHSVIHDQTHATKGLKIGNNVFIGPGVTTSNDRKMCHRRECMEFVVNAPIIGDGVRIGAGAVLLPGVVIGKNALIGGGSTVTRDIPENAIAFGNPARVVGEVREEERL